MEIMVVWLLFVHWYTFQLGYFFRYNWKHILLIYFCELDEIDYFFLKYTTVYM